MGRIKYAENKSSIKRIQHHENEYTTNAVQELRVADSMMKDRNN